MTESLIPVPFVQLFSYVPLSLFSPSEKLKLFPYGVDFVSFVLFVVNYSPPQPELTVYLS